MKLTSSIKVLLLIIITIIPILIFNPRLIAQELQFTELPGTAKDIGIGADGTVWVIGTDLIEDNEDRGPMYGIYKWNRFKQMWEGLSREEIIKNDIRAERISVDSDGKPWILNFNGNFTWISHQIPYFYSGSYLGEFVTDIGVATKNSVCWGSAAGSPEYGGHLYVSAAYKTDIWTLGKRKEETHVYPDETIDDFVTALFDQSSDMMGKNVIANVDTDGHSAVWFTDTVKSIGTFIFSNRLQDPKVTFLPGSANDIGVNASGDVWVVGTNPVAGGYEIFELVRHKHAEPKWKGHKVGAVRIDVAPSGNPWFINDKGHIFRAEYPPIRMEYWHEQEGKFNGQWVQRAGSSVYDAVWIAENGDSAEVIDANLVMHRMGNQVTINRINSSDGNNFQYKGSINGNKVVGTFVDSTSSGKIHNWNATIFMGIYNPGHRWTLDLRGGDRHKKPAFMYLERHGQTNIFNGFIPDNGEKTQFMIAIVDRVYPTSKEIQFVGIRRDIDNENRKFGFFRAWQNYTGWPPQQVLRGMYTGNDRTCSNFDKMEDECTWTVTVDF